jgi:UDPglucose 6-dehydrogenase
VWGLAFKPETDDMREAPSIVVIEGLLERGATVRAHDPEATATARRVFGDRVGFVDQNYDVLPGADALLILTEWQQYRVPDFARMKRLMREPLVIDGRNLFDPKQMSRYGFDYACIGRGRPALARPSVAGSRASA